MPAQKPSSAKATSTKAASSKPVSPKLEPNKPKKVNKPIIEKKEVIVEEVEETADINVVVEENNEVNNWEYFLF